MLGDYGKQQYGIQQVCENGHQMDDCYDNRIVDILNITEKPKGHCKKCGAASIIACQNCNEKIQGSQLTFGSKKTGASVGVPSYCSSCGKAYPWTESKIMTAIQLFAESGDLDDEEKETIEQDIKNIANDIPQAELSAVRIKRLWEKYGPVAYNVLMDFASKTVAEILKR